MRRIALVSVVVGEEISRLTFDAIGLDFNLDKVRTRAGQSPLDFKSN